MRPSLIMLLHSINVNAYAERLERKRDFKNHIGDYIFGKKQLSIGEQFKTLLKNKDTQHFTPSKRSLKSQQLALRVK